MRVSYKDFKRAVEDGVISQKDAERLYNYFDIKNGFKFSNVLLYFGGIVLIASMSISYSVMLSPLGGFFIILVYITGVYLFAKQVENKIIQNILSTFLIVLSPLLCYYFLKLIGVKLPLYIAYHHIVSYEWLIMELFTMITAFFVYKQFKNSFLMLPVAVSAWYFSLDFSSLIVHKLKLVENFWAFKAGMSIIVGILLVGLAIRFDLKRRIDMGFWFYVFGAVLIWAGGSYFLFKFLDEVFFHALFNFLFLLFGVLIRRNVFLVLSGIGFFIVFNKLAAVFDQMWIFPFIMSLSGFVIIYLGRLWAKREKEISEKFLSLLPHNLRGFFERLY